MVDRTGSSVPSAFPRMVLRRTSIPHDAVRITVGAASLTVSDDLRLAATVARTSHNVSDGQGF
jgi:hypothetical protein